jgi:Zn-dependent protease with chaperone function/Zn-finger nucleic acid-binding protein
LTAADAASGARRTFFEIEREKRWRVWVLFAALVAIVFAGVWVACLIVTASLFLSFPTVDTFTWVFAPRGVALILGLAVAASVPYWFASRVGARRRLLRAMHCKPLDPDDRYHQRLANIVEEMRIATGAPRIECVTVATLGLNAFAFSDLRGAGVVGVTEGALARLSRQQLEAVVAHEFGHILSGSYATATASCLLFGVYSELGDKLTEAAVITGASRAAPLAVVAILLRGWLWVLQLASSVTNAALSRERERQADLAAARYTRDPLSLAEALRVISRHPGGTGYIPEGLAPLCIRTTQTREPWLLRDWRSTHPPVGERIDALLALAHVSPDEFARQVDKAAGNFAAREHWTPAPPAAVLPVRPGAGVMACPSCGSGLSTADYEGLRVPICASCGGRLVSSAQVSKILARREAGFSDEQQRLAELIASTGDQRRRAALLARGRPGVDLVACPGCARTMMRRHYSYEHAVEIDYCSICDVFWFEKNELEALQILAERQTG